MSRSAHTHTRPLAVAREFGFSVGIASQLCYRRVERNLWRKPLQLHRLKPWRCALLLLVKVWGWSASAHAPSATFLQFVVASTNLTGFWDVAVRDLQQGLTHGVESKLLPVTESE